MICPCTAQLQVSTIYYDDIVGFSELPIFLKTKTQVENNKTYFQ